MNKICPLFTEVAVSMHSGRYLDTHECIKKECGFWSEEAGKCGVAVSNIKEEIE